MYKRLRPDDLHVGMKLKYYNRRPAVNSSGEISNTIHPLALYNAEVVDISTYHVTLMVTVEPMTLREATMGKPKSYRWSVTKYDIMNYDHLYIDDEDGVAV